MLLWSFLKDDIILKEVNVMVLSAGRRVELIKCFQNAAKKLSIKSNVIAADASDLSPALYFSDRKVLLPPVSEIKYYIDQLIKTILNEKVSLVVPTIDTELLVLAQYKEKIEAETNSIVLVSDIETIRLCRDKIAMQKFLEGHSIQTPKMVSEDEISNGLMTFPLFIKPVSGSSSINSFKVRSIEELHVFQKIVNKHIIQEFAEGPEYTVDVFLDFDSNILTIVPRLRMAIRGGEILKGKIEKNSEIIAEIKKILLCFKFIGQITVQLILTKKGVSVIEINPRFGGGAPMSIKCGADSCENLYKLVLGEKLEYSEDYRDGVYFLRFDDSVCISEDKQIA